MRKLVLALALAAGGCTTLNSHLDLDSYLAKNIPKIVEQQKKEFHLSYEGEPALPIVKYDVLEEKFGEYDFDTAAMTLDSIKLLRSGSRTTRNIVSHELVHHNNGLIRRRIGVPFRYTIPQRIIEEGTAAYVANRMTGEKVKCGKFENLEPQDYERFDISGSPDRTLVYNVGECVTGLVVQIYREQGIEYMMKHPPTEEEVRNPYAYTARMLGELAIESRKPWPPPRQ